eukprot:CAMPEP_0115215124 /NCGR_PEP_ID=MMETSP0270-20121206/24652_1 /TAXON_ID=71861 /ORGANISM="Scrippsiella trochoidea, Strain CCMP3099" /LENGTH=64 /DNA_ID=CAMNT_0002628903 /DNA_START=238 /DNA_END=432 /DNA_ORIENTATION=-
MKPLTSQRCLDVERCLNGKRGGQRRRRHLDCLTRRLLKEALDAPALPGWASLHRPRLVEVLQGR